MRRLVVNESELQISLQKHVLRTLHVAVMDEEHLCYVLQRPDSVSCLAVLFQIWLQRDLFFSPAKLRLRHQSAVTTDVFRANPNRWT